MSADITWTTAVIGRPDATIEAATEFWLRVTSSQLSAFRDGTGFRTMQPATGDPFLRVREVGSRVCSSDLDLHSPDPGTLASRAEDLGASLDMGTNHALISPSGVRFRSVPDRGDSTRQSPVPGRAGVLSLVDQLCLDITAESFEIECQFWAALTGWELRTGARPEFMYLARPAGIPLRLFLQRLDEPGSAERARVHLDLACENVARTMIAHTELGAFVVARFPFWTSMCDPSGAAYCLTRRDPFTGTLPS